MAKCNVLILVLFFCLYVRASVINTHDDGSGDGHDTSTSQSQDHNGGDQETHASTHPFQDAVNKVHLEDIEPLVNHDTFVTIKIAKKLHDLEVKEHELEVHENATETELKHYEHLQDELQKEVTRIEHDLENATKERHHLQEEIEDLEHFEADIKKHLSEHIAFSAYLSHDVNEEIEHPSDVTYDKTFFNSEHAYDEKTGVFTAPTDGLYVFSWSHYVPAGHVFDSEIHDKDHAVGQSHCDNTNGTAGEICTETTPLILHAHDTVNIHKNRGDHLKGDGSSTFRGWRVN